MTWCPKPIKGVALRLTRNNACGAALAPTVANSRIAAEAFVSLTMTPDYYEGEEIEVPLANGGLCVYDSPEPVLRGFELELSVCGLPFPMLEMLAGFTALEDASSNIIGAMSPESMVPRNANSVQLEVWQRNHAAGCGGGVTDLYVHHVLTKTRKWRVTGDLEIADAALECVLTGYAEKNPNWTPAVTAEFTTANVAIIKAGGPWGYQAAATLPALDDCDYVPASA